MPKARKISKTEKTLRGKLKYQRSKINKVNKQITKLLKENNYNYEAKLPEGVKLNAKINSLMEVVTKENNKVTELIYKIEKRFKKYKPKNPVKEAREEMENEDRAELGKVWERKDIENQIFNILPISSVMKRSFKKDTDSIYDILNNFYSKMNSRVILVGYINERTGNLFLQIEGEEE